VPAKVFLEQRDHVPREKSVNCRSAGFCTAEADLPKSGSRIAAKLVRSPIRHGDVSVERPLEDVCGAVDVVLIAIPARILQTRDPEQSRTEKDARVVHTDTSLTL